MERTATCTLQHTNRSTPLWTRAKRRVEHETRLLQQVRTRCQRVDVCAQRRIQRADLNCLPAEEMVFFDKPNWRPTLLIVVSPRSSLAMWALYLRSAT
jgi:hypothetical protein